MVKKGKKWAKKSKTCDTVILSPSAETPATPTGHMDSNPVSPKEVAQIIVDTDLSQTIVDTNPAQTIVDSDLAQTIAKLKRELFDARVK